MTDTGTQTPGRRGSAEIVTDYNYFREGDIEPHMGKTIRFLIYKEKDFIVYLDEELYVQWAFTAAQREFTSEEGQALNRVSELQALPISHLKEEHRKSYRMLIGEAVARILGKNVAAAKDALNKATQILL